MAINNLQLLIVDDDVDLGRHLKSFFERFHYKVEVATNGLQAVEFVERYHPHLVFLDIGLPGLSGIDVLKKIKSYDASIRVIMITGQTEDELKREAKMLGADDYVTKPFSLDYLNGEVMNKLHNQLFHELRTTSSDLALEREKVDLLFEQVKDGAIILNAQGLIFSMNPVAQHLLQMSLSHNDVTLQMAFQQFTLPNQKSWEPYEQWLSGPFDLVREQPKRLVLEARLNPILNRKKESYGYILLFRDVTQERKAESAMHRFISLISHKLRTPLVTMVAYPKLLLSEKEASPLNDFQRNALQTISSQCRRMETLVNQLIAFSSLDPSEIQTKPIGITGVLQQAQKAIPEEYALQESQLVFDPVLDSMKVVGDPILLRDAFQNLFENAFKFGAKTVHVSAVKTDSELTIQVVDDGPGIPPEDHGRVFDRFFQVEKDFSGQVPGAGLGLTMVKHVIEAHRGRIRLESELGKGTRFFVTLPSVA